MLQSTGKPKTERRNKTCVSGMLLLAHRQCRKTHESTQLQFVFEYITFPRACTEFVTIMHKYLCLYYLFIFQIALFIFSKKCYTPLVNDKYCTNNLPIKKKSGPIAHIRAFSIPQNELISKWGTYRTLSPTSKQLSIHPSYVSTFYL